VNGTTLYIDKKISYSRNIARWLSLCAVQGHSRSLIFVPIESPYATKRGY